MMSIWWGNTEWKIIWRSVGGFWTSSLSVDQQWILHVQKTMSLLAFVRCAPWSVAKSLPTPSPHPWLLGCTGWKSRNSNRLGPKPIFWRFWALIFLLFSGVHTPIFGWGFLDNFPGATNPLNICLVKLYFHLFLQSDQHFHGLTHPEGEPPILFFVDNIFTC